MRPPQPANRQEVRPRTKQKGEPWGSPSVFFRLKAEPYLIAALLLATAAHLFGDDADLLDAGALGGVDHGNDFAVAKLAIAGDEHRLFLARLEDVAEARLEILERHRLVTDR